MRPILDQITKHFDDKKVLNMKNPFYYLVNFAVSFATGICIFVRAPSPLFATIVFILTLLYLFIALMLVRKRGRLTFRVK